MAKISYTTARVIVGFELLICASCFANYYFDWEIFGRFGKEFLILSFVVVALTMHFSGITLKDIQEYRDSKQKNA